MWEYSKIVYYRQAFLRDVTVEKFFAVFEKPLVKKYASEYQNPDSILYIADYTLQTCPETVDKKQRITITRDGQYDEEGNYHATFYHFEYDKEEDFIRLLTQDGNGYDFIPYELSYNHTVMYDNARVFFKLIDIWLSEYAIRTGTGKTIFPEDLDDNGEEIQS